MSIVRNLSKTTFVLLIIQLILFTACTAAHLSRQKDQGQFYLQQGLDLIAAQKYSLAIQALSLCLEKRPESTKALFWRAKAASLAKRYSLALQDIATLLKKDPDDIPALVLRAKIYLAQEKFDRARKDICQALDRVSQVQVDQDQTADQYQYLAKNPVPRPGELYYDLGNIFLAENKTTEAIHCFSQAIDLLKTFAPAYNNRGTAFFRQGLFAKAISDFSQAIALTPNQARYLFNRGLCYMKAKRTRKAIADFSQALDLDPGFSLARYNRGLLLLEQNQENQGCQDLQKVCSQAGLCQELKKQHKMGHCISDEN